MQAKPSRTEPDRTGPRWTEPSEWLFTLQAELTRTESSAAEGLNYEDVKPSACIFVDGQYTVEKPLIY
jgi:hypothetical protein